MTKLSLIMAAVAVSLAAVSCGPKKDAPKVLVLYYSQNGHTKTVAKDIAKSLGATTEEIVALNPYNDDFQATIGRCMVEREAGILPEIKPIEANLAEYDYIFLGSPVWFGTFAPPVITLLGQIDLSDKKVVPFFTFGSGGLESGTADLKARQPKADVLPGYGVREARMAAASSEVDRFLKGMGLVEGEVEKLDDFPKQHPVSDEEAAIFDAAVAGYQMLSAKASAVAMRNTPWGVEYKFAASPVAKEGAPDMPPAADMTVYVLVEEGKAPVFTRVVR